MDSACRCCSQLQSLRWQFSTLSRKRCFTTSINSRQCMTIDCTQLSWGQRNLHLYFTWRLRIGCAAQISSCQINFCSQSRKTLKLDWLDTLTLKFSHQKDGKLRLGHFWRCVSSLSLFISSSLLSLFFTGKCSLSMFWVILRLMSKLTTTGLPWIMTREIGQSVKKLTLEKC